MLLRVGSEPSLELAHHRHQAGHFGDRIEQGSARSLSASARAARIRGAHASQASMYSSRRLSNRSPSAINAASAVDILIKPPRRPGGEMAAGPDRSAYDVNNKVDPRVGGWLWTI